MAFSASELTFDASSDAGLPEEARIFTHPSLKASVVISEGRLRISPGVSANSARAAVSLPAKNGSFSAKVRELKLDFEPFKGASANDARAGLWVGFVTSARESRSVFSVGGDWIGVVLEVKEFLDGKYSVIVNERWETGEANAIADDVSSRVHVCELTACPTQIDLRVAEGELSVSFTDAEVAALAKNIEGKLGGSKLKKLLSPEMQQVLEEPLDAAFGFANYGELEEAPELFIKKFSVTQ